ncbi:filament integrity protein fraC [Microcoleus sp. FACHB-831]|uniref:filament integrity protein FraC n=1 Tax=Microcoleus sp. FACHB-831 TaxID=2692827 RepID=UPI001682A06F|nr:filament integrity protein FraC [Microcoleus sp. FACHB-831]MBD1923546.1 filament integrity protein fraC [Microcoleus sp. FACHB-831]
MNNVLPLQAILWQLFFLLIAIALEGYILQLKLNLSRKASIDYAMAINLITTILGWFSFFYLLPILPNYIKYQAIGYIFLDRFTPPQTATLTLEVILTLSIIFMSAFIVKLQSLKLLQRFLEPPKENESAEDQKNKLNRGNRLSSLKSTFSLSNPSKATVILVANALSSSVIVLILLVRSLRVHNNG